MNLIGKGNAVMNLKSLIVFFVFILNISAVLADVRIEAEANSDNGLHVKITTDHLILESVTLVDMDNFYHLYSDPKTIEKYADRRPRLNARAHARVSEWIDQWKNGDPRAGFSVLFERCRG